MDAEQKFQIRQERIQQLTLNLKLRNIEELLIGRQDDEKEKLQDEIEELKKENKDLKRQVNILMTIIEKMDGKSIIRDTEGSIVEIKE